jgi:threonine dehydratase
MHPLEPVSLADVMAARNRIAGKAHRTPLVRLNVDTAADIYLKLENLQPIGSFKIRGAGNAMLKHKRAALAKGVYTASAGNMAQGVAWNAKQMGIPCHVIVPDSAPSTKLDAIERLGAIPIKVAYDEWWRVIVTHHFPGLDALFIHPVSDTNVMAGHATIALEILDDLPDVDVVLVPYGGGGLSCGIASVMKDLRPSTKVFACEVETAAPFAASLERGDVHRRHRRQERVERDVAVGQRSACRLLGHLGRPYCQGDPDARGTQPHSGRRGGRRARGRRPDR